MSKYPAASDYQAAIQNPQLVFRQPELQACRVRVNRLGMPIVSSGGFALSFYLAAPDGEQWVVRCFKGDSPDRRARYDAISRFLNVHPDPLLLDVDYYDQGILVDGVWYPVVKMPLVRGVTLQRFIETELAGGRSITHLSEKFRAAVRRLEQLGIAHGDLQHGNIMVQGGELVLVDYDGMYVPELRGWPPAEIGSAAYQHPLRKEQFGPELDRFSAIVIDVALQALAARPDLWEKYNTGENLLFRQADFLQPQASTALAELEQISHLRVLAPRLRAICQAPFETIPRLEEVVPPLPASAALPLPLGAGSAKTSTEDDIDAQLNRLYAAWSPAQTPVAPTRSASPVTTVAAAPSALPASTSAQDDNWREVAWLLRRLPKMLRLIWVALIFSLTFGRMIFGGLADLFTPDALPGSALTPRQAVVRQANADDLRAQSVESVCPTDLYVNLVEPRKVVINDMLQFSWRTNKNLVEPCQFQLSIWREGGARMLVTPIFAPEKVGSTYSTDVYMPRLLPPDQRQAGTFFWTVVLTSGSASSEPIPTHGAPLEFYWKPVK